MAGHSCYCLLSLFTGKPFSQIYIIYIFFMVHYWWTKILSKDHNWETNGERNHWHEWPAIVLCETPPCIINGLISSCIIVGVWILILGEYFGVKCIELHEVYYPLSCVKCMEYIYSLVKCTLIFLYNTPIELCMCFMKCNYVSFNTTIYHFILAEDINLLRKP